MRGPRGRPSPVKYSYGDRSSAYSVRRGTAAPFSAGRGPSSRLNRGGVDSSSREIRSEDIARRGV